MSRLVLGEPRIVGKAIVEVAAIHELHHNVDVARRVQDFLQADNVLVLRRLHDCQFSRHERLEVFAHDAILTDRFHRVGHTGRRVDALSHGGDGARAEYRAQLVFSYLLRIGHLTS